MSRLRRLGRFALALLRELGDESDQRRLVHVTPRQMIGASQIVELVTEVAVMTAGIQVQEQLNSGDGGHQHASTHDPRLAVLVLGHECCFLNPAAVS